MRELLHWARHKRGYELALWTSASAPVAQGVAKHIFAAPKFDLLHDCVMVLDQTACGRKGRTDRNTPNFVKPLERIWLNPKYENVYTSANTLILDNEESKTALNAENAVRVTTFDPSQENAEFGSGNEDEDEDFGEGGALWHFLDALARQPDVDVQNFMKSNPIDSFRGMN
ncbi:Hypothetical Protein FCC1311_081752 [Hondaea fermentalgiana]|uniref:FCP1 homology domain-containing protein n=1 Tax=Hondaea fermentalgiana TaxID=2315210 RepID=A0A2R5GM43_9STRA|nr:Hypothetical Protein FCC1311_081752 [Hondaea fermentalgiana]|eukprot:GBG31950.1 Hypothetical Protein FCC1311_081752 [Hondaea fermentalgiana]